MKTNCPELRNLATTKPVSRLREADERSPKGQTVQTGELCDASEALPNVMAKKSKDIVDQTVALESFKQLERATSVYLMPRDREYRFVFCRTWTSLAWVRDTSLIKGNWLKNLCTFCWRTFFSTSAVSVSMTPWVITITSSRQMTRYSCHFEICFVILETDLLGYMFCSRLQCASWVQALRIDMKEWGGEMVLKRKNND